MAGLIRILVALSVTVGCVYLAFRGAQWDEILAVIRRTDYFWVGVMVAASVLTIYLRAVRWQVLLVPTARVGVRPLFSATSVGFMANMLLPLRAGEVIRPVMAGRQTGVATSAAFASVALERLLDLFLLFAFLVVLGLVVPLPQAMAQASYVVAAFVLAILVVLVVLLRYREATVGRVRRALERLPGTFGGRVADVVESFVMGLSGIADPRTVGLLFVHSLLIWVVIASTFGFALYALNVQAPFVAASVSLVVLVAAFVALPQAPGYFGTWQAGCMAALAFYSVPTDQALALSLVTHGVQIVVVVLLGLVCLATEDVGFRELMALASRQEGKEP